MHPGYMLFMLIFALPVVLIVGCFVVWALKVVSGGSGRQREEVRTEETRLIQEIHQGLLKMEERIEALETILLDPSRKDDAK